ncbi:DUF2180 family protein [Geoalkalibacter subterraneus]|jgi:hypothetical protein|uniref:DUF2180 family protein n=1 Tax=Geoalkalibacter subterraneus TaxID=483547 RepID=A0A0B5FTP3_9BACT|nr:DUF2180 family protein [Geoalkalibacter subterraneus]AJF07525.1 hypothetical protein GSUB_14560 [Geoalkalibacter subterraneus]
MNCYPCARENKETPAVAVCSVCGKGLCLEHTVERELPLVQRVSGWVDQSLIHLLCAECAEVKTLTD